MQIYQESIDFFGVPGKESDNYYLVDKKSGQIQDPAYYVRDFYFFKRSQYPQLQLQQMKPSDAYQALQRRALHQKSIEVGQVLMALSVLKSPVQ
ncbi:unnamed protein product, partial [Cyprideis torosa]